MLVLSLLLKLALLTPLGPGAGLQAPAPLPLSAPAEAQKKTPAKTAAKKPASKKGKKKKVTSAKVSLGELVIPVAGVQASALRDTYSAGRSGGRTHQAIDIMAPQNTPVLAAAAGTVVKMYTNRLGGICMYVLSEDKKVVYYYAHLDHYADEVSVGQQVQQGQLLAYVGDTGNAPPGAYHLHFSVARLSDPKRYWDGANTNPYTHLKKGRSIPLGEVAELQAQLALESAVEGAAGEQAD